MLLMACVLAVNEFGPVQLKLKVGVPPAGVMVAEPSAALLQVLLLSVFVITSNGGSTRFIVVVTGHPFESVTVAVYPPAHKLVCGLLVALGVHVNVYGKTPPLGISVISPLQSPLHCGCIILEILSCMTGLSVSVNCWNALQPPAETVSVTIPLHNALTDGDVLPVLQL